MGKKPARVFCVVNAPAAAADSAAPCAAVLVVLVVAAVHQQRAARPGARGEKQGVVPGLLGECMRVPFLLLRLGFSELPFAARASADARRSVPEQIQDLEDQHCKGCYAEKDPGPGIFASDDPSPPLVLKCEVVDDQGPDEQGPCDPGQDLRAPIDVARLASAAWNQAAASDFSGWISFLDGVAKPDCACEEQEEQQHENHDGQPRIAAPIVPGRKRRQDNPGVEPFHARQIRCLRRLVTSQEGHRRWL